MTISDSPNERHRPAPSAIAWGSLWGAALGVWWLGGRFIEVHQVGSASASEWAALGVSLLGMFALLGGILGFEIGLVLLGWETVRRRPFHDRRAVFALAMPSLLVIGYLALAAGTERAIFGRVIGYRGPTPIIAATAFAVAWVFVARALYRAVVRRGSSRGLAPLLVVIAVAGGAVLPLRATSAASPAAVKSPPLERATAERGAPLLFVGIDSGNWRLLDALLAQGKAPFFASMVKNGLTGEIRALWPPFWSAPAWAAIVTGYAPEESGVHEDLIASAPGLPVLAISLMADLMLTPVFEIEYGLLAIGALRVETPPRSLLRRDPLWEMLTRAGIRTAVVRFNFTYPARGEASYAISDRAGIDVWAPVGVRPESGEGVVYPSTLVVSLPDERLARQSAAEILIQPGDPLPRNVRGDPVNLLPLALDVDERTVQASKGLLRDHPDLDVLAVYLKGFDIVCHTLWPYRFPEDFPSHPPSQAEQRALGAVMDRYFEFLDRSIADLVAAFPTPPNVIIVADHGATASDGHQLWQGWHGEHGGLFLAAGPSVTPRSGRPEVTYFDVVPTALDLLGFRAPWLRGHTLLAPGVSAR